MKNFSIIIFLFLFSNVFGQYVKPDERTSESKIYSIVAEQPQPEGGMGKFYRFINNEMNYPEEAIKAGIEGRVFVQFVVDEEGNIPQESIKVVQGVHPLLDEETVRLISISDPWEPGKKENGDPAAVRMILPITFKL